jgi:hypothetical protein
MAASLAWALLAFAPGRINSAAQVSDPAGKLQGQSFRMSEGQIVVDRFDLRAAVLDDSLTVSLNTDLGDSAVVYVEVSRFYRPPGHNVAYPVKYFSETSTVGQWRRPRTVRLDEQLWRQEFQLRRKSLSVLERPIEAPAISDDVVVRAMLPPYQPPPFSDGNANLVGKTIKTPRLPRFISRSVTIRHPLADPASALAQ